MLFNAPTCVEPRSPRICAYSKDGRVERLASRPVLKHGPRSLTLTRVAEFCERAVQVLKNLDRRVSSTNETRLRRNESKQAGTAEKFEKKNLARARAHPSGVVKGASRTECERKSWYPKDGDLCRGRVKPEETLVKARRDSDVQIDRLILA